MKPTDITPDDDPVTTLVKLFGSVTILDERGFTEITAKQLTETEAAKKLFVANDETPSNS